MSSIVFTFSIFSSQCRSLALSLSYAHRLNAGRSLNASSRFTDFVQRRRVACVQCTGQMNNKKEYTEIYSSLSLSHPHHGRHHRQQQHRRHSLLQVWHHRRNKHNNIRTKLWTQQTLVCVSSLVLEHNGWSELTGLFVTRFWGDRQTPRFWSRLKKKNKRQRGDRWPLTSAACDLCRPEWKII